MDQAGGGTDSSPEHPAAGGAVPQRLVALWAYRSRLVATFRRRGVRPADAEDAATEAILRVATCGSFVPGAADPWPYLRTAAAHILTDEHRRAVKEEMLTRDARWCPRECSFEEDIANRDVARRELSRIWAAESELVARMMLRRADGLTWTEVFAEFGVSASAGQSRIWRAQQRASRRRARCLPDQKDSA